MFPITQEAEIWNISSLEMYLAPHKISEEPLTILFMSKKNTCFLSREWIHFFEGFPKSKIFLNKASFRGLGPPQLNAGQVLCLDLCATLDIYLAWFMSYMLKL